MKTSEIRTKDLRINLKQIVLNELAELPGKLNELSTEKRLNLICRLLPFVLPKVDSVRHDAGEPDDFSEWL